MTAYLFANHLLNFVAPAAFVSVLLVMSARLFGGFFTSKRPPAQSIWAQAAIFFVVSVIILIVGLFVFGRDGKMATYAALVIGAALCQWVLLQGWRRG
jgi:hypothetical protein